ncbi:MAG: hypothetical protein B6I26_03955 [Desulfobacteraceae bacterium 4572_130]|nr:MAG: hypothetical protein B6I26_03955 [Desulfobacteraceae bacterium 4572_130]
MSKTEKKLGLKKDNNSIEEINQKSDNVLDNLPPKAKKIIEVGMSMHEFDSMQNPLADKINEKHIDKILELAEKDDERSFKDAGETRKFTLIYLLIFAILFIFLTIFLVGSDKELYKEIIKILVIFLGGLGSGFGIKSHMERNK